MEKRLTEFLRLRANEGLLRGLTETVPLPGGCISIDGREYVNFSSNDYLGLSSHPALADAASKALSPCLGVSASRLMTGSTKLHHELEKRIAEFKHKPAGIVFNSGYQANVGIISALCGRGDCIFSDRLNHASIVDGALLSGAKVFRFKHNDAEHLESLIAEHRADHNEALIVTETVFSMDGDISPIKEIASLKEKYSCMLMVDEAHATGIFGKTGSGIVNQNDLADHVDIIMGTFSKALGGFGAYAATSETIRDYLINTCRSFIYSTALPAAIIAANIAALEIIENEPHRRETLIAESSLFRELLTNKGLTVRGETQIVPVITGKSNKCVQLSERLKEKGYWVTPVRPPTVPKGEARLRISLSFDHSRETLDKFAEDIHSVFSDGTVTLKA